MKIFGFGQDCFVIEIDAIKNCKQTVLYTTDIYTKVAKKFLDDKS